MERIAGSAISCGLKDAATTGRALLYADPARFLAHLVFMIGNFGFVFLALHLMTKTMASIVPGTGQKGP